MKIFKLFREISIVMFLLLILQGSKSIAVAQINLDSGLVLHYPFNGNTNDQSGHGHHGINNGATFVNDRFGRVNSATFFDGTNDYISNTTNDWDQPSGALCIWFKPGRLFYGVDQRFFQNYGGVGARGYTIVPNTDSSMIGIADIIKEYKAYFKVNDSTWYSAITTWNTIQFSIWVNGFPILTNSWSSIRTYPNGHVLGKCRDTVSFPFKGILDDVRVYNRMLTSNEIIALYNELPSPNLISPQNGSLVTTLTPTLTWESLESPNYKVQVSQDSSFTNVIDSVTTSTNQYIIPTGILSNLNTYYWRVRACNPYLWSWSDTWKFFTLATEIKTISLEIPDRYKLFQNYPNPFNPVTNIKFDIPKSSFVKITLHNVLGEEVSILVNDELKAGRYEVDWNGSGYPSGVYFYRLETKEFIEVKKMLLVK